MTADEIRAAVPEENRDGPNFWLSEFGRCCEYLKGLKKAQVWGIGQSAGGRPLIAAAYGEKEGPVRATSTSFSAAGWGGFETFFGEQERKNQVFSFIGNIHGAETEGSVAALNLLNLLEHGVDLRGREHPRLLDEAKKMRIVIVLHANPDGAARNPLNNIRRMNQSLLNHLTFGTWTNGEPLIYADSKRYFPIPLGDVKRIGSYFNDQGVNLVLDNFFCSTAQPESRALADLYLSERPDCVVQGHSNAGQLALTPSPYLPPGVQHRQSHLGAALGMRFYKEGKFRNRISATGPGEWLPPSFTSELVPYFVCGAVPLLIEFPYGQREEETLDVLLDYGLGIFEELLIFGNKYGFRPGPPSSDYAINPFTGKPLRSKKNR